jgi:hypothetical protein
LAGQCTLISSVTSTIPTHVMECCLLPNPICKKLDKLNRDFLWDDTSTTKKLHLLNWKTVTRPKSEGGLGIKRSRCRNLAFLAKRNWELQLGSHSKWAHLLRSKYPLNRAPNYRKSVTWKSLCSSTPLCDKGKGWLIRDGQSINFWYDIWMGNKYMRESLIGPLARNEGTATISDVWDSSGLWNLSNLSFNLTHALWNTIQGVPRPLTPSASYSQF